eukprot:12708554-Heterocapsa_arctica.AAC.1
MRVKQPMREVRQEIRSVENMAMGITHSELPPTRTCIQMTKGKTATMKGIGQGCDQKSCFTCLAQKNITGYKNT